MPEESKGRRPGWSGLVKYSLALYVGYNLLMANFATIIHRVEFRVTVVRDDTAGPVAGARVTRPARTHRPEDLLGRRDSTGKVRFADVIQQQPLWCWPMIGSFHFRGHELEVAADGFQTRRIKLQDELPSVPLSSSSVRLRIALRPQ